NRRTCTSHAVERNSDFWGFKENPGVPIFCERNAGARPRGGVGEAARVVRSRVRRRSASRVRHRRSWNRKNHSRSGLHCRTRRVIEHSSCARAMPGTLWRWRGISSVAGWIFTALPVAWWRSGLTVLRHQAPAWLAQMPSLVPQSERANLQAQAMGATRERILREMAEAIETLSSETALVLLLEDLHWSDYSTVDLVSYLARRRDPARLMIGTYRPVDVIVADHPLKGGKRELQAHGLCRELALECLSEEVVAEFLSARFPRHQFPARLRQTVYRRTEGTPLFMVNLVEYLADQQAIVEEQGSWKLRAELSEVERGVPSNLRDLIQKQIERLSPDERTVLEAASVAGMECSSVAIAAGLENTVEWVEEYCEELARRHQFLSPAWLVQLPNGSVTPRHRFIHVLYREVPYRMIPP